MKRIFYLIAMYTGLRAAFNLVSGWPLPSSSVAILDRIQLSVFEDNDFKIRVHARIQKTIANDAQAGMVSVYYVRPGISRWLYSIIRLSSHFGCGHFELAFYELENRVTFYAVRNILESNMYRLRIRRFNGLRVLSREAEMEIVRRIFCELKLRGIETEFACPQECVSLAIDESLVLAKSREEFKRSMLKRYERISQLIC